MPQSDQYSSTSLNGQNQNDCMKPHELMLTITRWLFEDQKYHCIQHSNLPPHREAKPYTRQIERYSRVLRKVSL